MLDLSNQPHVKLYRYSHQDDSYILQLTQKTELDKIEKRLFSATLEEPTMKFLLFEYFNELGKMVGKIYTSHIYLFDLP